MKFDSRMTSRLENIETRQLMREFVINTVFDEAKCLLSLRCFCSLVVCCLVLETRTNLKFMAGGRSRQIKCFCDISISINSNKEK